MLTIELFFAEQCEMKFGMKLKGGLSDCFKTLLKLSGYLIFIKDKQKINCKAERMVQNNPEKYVAKSENIDIKLEVDPIKFDADELEFLICCSLNE